MRQRAYEFMWNVSNTDITSFGDTMITIVVVTVVSCHIFENKSKAVFYLNSKLAVSRFCVTKSVESTFGGIEMQCCSKDCMKARYDTSSRL